VGRRGCQTLLRKLELNSNRDRVSRRPAPDEMR